MVVWATVHHDGLHHYVAELGVGHTVAAVGSYTTPGFDTDNEIEAPEMKWYTIKAKQN